MSSSQRAHPPIPLPDGEVDPSPSPDSRLAATLEARRPEADCLVFRCCGRSWTLPNASRYTSSMCRFCGGWVQPETDVVFVYGCDCGRSWTRPIVEIGRQLPCRDCGTWVAPVKDDAPDPNDQPFAFAAGGDSA